MEGGAVALLTSLFHQSIVSIREIGRIFQSEDIAIEAILLLNREAHRTILLQNAMIAAGIATMIQYKTGFSISYMSLLINVPLSVLAYFLIQKDFAVKTLLFSVVYSVVFLMLQNCLPPEYRVRNKVLSPEVFHRQQPWLLLQTPLR